MSELIAHLLDLLQPLGEVRARRMFGGYGLYLGNRMFGLVAEGTLYLKVDADSERDYAEAGLPCFSYLRQGRPVKIHSFRQAPADALELGDELCRRAGRAVQAARRSRKG
jgi:DNA transformation protein